MGPPPSPSQPRPRHCGVGSEHTCAMHVTPEWALQQSLVVLHLSPFWEHPMGFELHMGAPPSAPPAQYPPQQSVPDAQPCPSLAHGGSDMNPRIARLVSSCPCRWKAAWLGSTPGLGF